MGLLKRIRGMMGGDNTKTETDIRPPFRPNPEKQKDESGYYKIVCPHCLEEFPIWDVEFRAGAGVASKDITGASASNVDTAALLFDDEKKTVSRRTTLSAVEDTEELTAFPREIDENNTKFLCKVGKLRKESEAKPQNKILRLFDEKGMPTGEVTRVKLMGKEGEEINNWIYLNGKTAKDPELHHKPLATVQDKYGYNSSVRVCPHCHNEISNLLGLYPSYVIGVVGNTFCGKSVYITKLCGAIENAEILSTEGGNQIIGHNPMGESVGQEAEKLTKSGIQGDALLDPTRIEYIEPRVMECNRGGKERFTLIIFDFPGEALQKGKDIPKFLSHYSDVESNVDGWMFLFDCANLNSIDSIIKNYHEELVEFLPDNLIGSMETDDLSGEIQQKKQDAVSMKPQDVLRAFQNKFIKGVFTAPVSLVITKSDILKMIHETIRKQYSVSTVPNPTFLQGYNYYDEDEVNLDLIASNSKQIETLLGKQGLNDPVISHIEDCLRDGHKDEYAWFTVSAMGTPVKIGHQADHATPIRIEEPFVWLLYMLGVIPGKSDDNELWR